MRKMKEVINALQQRGYSQESLAKIGKVSQASICRWSKKNPTLVNIRALEKLSKKLEAEAVKK